MNAIRVQCARNLAARTLIYRFRITHENFVLVVVAAVYVNPIEARDYSQARV